MSEGVELELAAAARLLVGVMRRVGVSSVNQVDLLCELLKVGDGVSEKELVLRLGLGQPFVNKMLRAFLKSGLVVWRPGKVRGPSGKVFGVRLYGLSDTGRGMFEQVGSFVEGECCDFLPG